MSITTAMDWSVPNSMPSQYMNVSIDVMITLTQKMDVNEVMKFLVTIISTIKEKDIAIAIPWKAEETKATSTGIDGQGPVCLIVLKVGAVSLASSLRSSVSLSHLSKYGCLFEPGAHYAIFEIPETCMYFILPSIYSKSSLKTDPPSEAKN